MDSAEQIREAATHLFARHGYEGASLQAIAARVGVTKQTLLYHYPSKDALRRAVVDGVFAHFGERLPQMLEAFTSGHDRFEALTRELFAFFAQDGNRARVLMRELLDNPDEMQRLLSQHLRPWTLLVSQYIREGQRVDLIHQDVDPEAYVLNVIALVLANVAMQPLLTGIFSPAPNSQDDSAERQRDELLRLTRTGLFKR